MTDKLAIVGTHPDTRDNAPWNDSTYDIWVFNEAAQADWCKRWDACFQLHAPEIYRSPHNRSRADHWGWLQQKHSGIIYMQSVDALVPSSAVFPVAEVESLTGEKWFTSSLAYSIALAVLKGYKVIELYGADLTSNTEYAYQAENVRALIYFARGRGVDVRVKCWPDIFTFPLYGYEGAVGIEHQYFKENADRSQAEFDAAEKSLKNIKTAVMKHIERGEWEQAQGSIEKYRNAAELAGKLSGSLSEYERYAKITSERAVDRQEYEFNSALGAREAAKLQEQVSRIHGATEYVWNVAKQTNSQAAKAQLLKFALQLGQSAYELGAWVGKRDTNFFCTGLFDKLLTAAGGRKSYEVVTHDNH